MKAPRHLGCDGQIVAWRHDTDEGWCRCRRRWTALQILSGTALDMGLKLTSAFRAVTPAMKRMSDHFRTFGARFAEIQRRQALGRLKIHYPDDS